MRLCAPEVGFPCSGNRSVPGQPILSGATERPRYSGIDAARGLGVVGIGLCNVPGLAGQPDLVMSVPVGFPLPDQVIWVGIQTCGQGRFVALLSLLFGISLLWVGGDGTDPEKSRRLTRRLYSLAIIGICHGCILWWGDILLPYALCGFAVRTLRECQPRHLIGGGFLAYFFGVLLLRIDGGITILTSGHMTSQAVAASLPWRTSASFAGDCLELVTENARTWIALLPVSILSVLVTCAPMMLIGMGLYRMGELTPVVTGRLARGGVISGIASSILLMPFALNGVGLLPFPTDATSEDMAYAIVTLRLLFAPFGAIMLVSIPVLIPAVRRLLAPLGRLTLSAYLTQSLVGRTGFILLSRSEKQLPGYGTEIFLMASFLILEIIIALLWNRLGARMGPAEMLWRKIYR